MTRIWKEWKQGIINGVNPEHPEYWGEVEDYDQRLVEMAVFGMGMALAPERFFFELPEAAQKNLHAWLNQINFHDMPKNNWTFFRVLVNMGFMVCSLPYDRPRMEKDFAMIEEHYEGDGWYFDYFNQREYYTMWAFHFYGLVYAKVMGERDPERSAEYIRRGKLMAPDFACWFDASCEALPYGRSLTYRFAQSCFWSALALADAKPEGMAWGEIKHLLLSNIRAWMQLPIFDRGGVLTVGYGYPNLCISEGYNAPGSPYWAMKVFAVLALPEEHPFWQSEETAYAAPERFLDEQVRLLITRDRDNSMVTAYTAGNHAYEHMHEDEKYEKFAYSSQFTFSIVKEAGTLNKGAFDSMLALREEGQGLWHGRSGCDTFALSEEAVICRWSPLKDVLIDTQIIPVDGRWHIRRHTIRTARPLEAAEGAFAVKRDWAGERPCDRIRTVLCADDRSAAAHGGYGTSAIYAISGYTAGEVLSPECNTNLVHARTLLPTLHAKLTPGTNELICAVYCAPGDEAPTTIPQEVLDHAK